MEIQMNPINQSHQKTGTAYVIETTSNIHLHVQEVFPIIENDNELRQLPPEICFVVDECNEKDATVVCVSKKEAKRLAEILFRLAE